jgi:hypothetical protein
MGLVKRPFDKVGMGLVKRPFDKVGMGLVKRPFDKLGMGLVKRPFDRVGMGLVKRPLDRVGLGLIRRSGLPLSDLYFPQTRRMQMESSRKLRSNALPANNISKRQREIIANKLSDSLYSNGLHMKQ